MEINSGESISEIFAMCRTIAVVGLSSNPARPSNDVAGFMRQHGYRIIPVNPNEAEVFGEKSFPSLLLVPETVDLVSIFRRSEEAGQHVDDAIKIGAKAVWMQDGVIDHAAAQRALDAGLMVVMDRCWLRDYMRR